MIFSQNKRVKLYKIIIIKDREKTMKTKKIIIAALLAIAPVLGFAQEWDEIYANPAQKQSFKAKNEQSQKKKIVVVEGNASNMRVTANGRSIDEYNRRGNNNLTDSLYAQDSTYQQYQYTDRIVRFHDPESSVKITGADDVTVYVGDDLYADYYQNRGSNTNIYLGWGASSYYPWYDSWYDPWYYGSSWDYPYYGYYGSRWYDPWCSRRGWYSPWYYNSWYSPYYGGWYDSWYYGGYYGGGYYQGYYDGYYSALPRSSTGRSSGTYRTSSANRMTASGMGSGRTSYSRSSSDIITRSSSSGRSSSYNSREGSSRTRIVDEYGRVYDSRSGRTIDRSSYSTPSRSVYGSGRESSSRTYESTTPRSSSYSRSSSGYERSSSSSSYDRSSSRSSSSYSAPSRSSSSYSEPSRSSYSGRSSFDSSSSRSSSSSFDSSSSRSSSSSGSSGSSSSGRSSGGRR